MAEGPQADPERPLSDAAYAALQDFVDDLIASNSFTEAEMMNTNSSVMAAESFDLAMRNVYPGVASGTVLTADYKAQAKILTHQRVTLAGYRLATILNSALAGVSLDTINESMKEIQDSVKMTQTGDIFNYYSLKGVERGAAAGIFLSCFAVGCLLAAAVTYAICLARRAKSSEKTTLHTPAVAHDTNV
ncbi:putative 3'-nucleotidase/nuclease [Leptomonas seymouri]|uniref:Putative 3'-nucleotidase/nuclease n=1 Tax=Leptomonas seymouri TaxID=5684 RepID=A0A0N1HST3_LEPSE|nr:putative 3'-nucleotidase/nuclease [Leptomonas seymouri]|eukprot:KPI82632.1 putative 3'-nucleotidase/nuclease [Leptomonas seymouri]